jgi:cation transport protein ChaC
MTEPLQPIRDPEPMLVQALAEWGGTDDLWVFGYGSLIWKTDFAYAERRPARVQGWHRALKMWSRINRGTPDCPGLVFGLFTGGSCQGVAYRIAREQGRGVMAQLWAREMMMGVYDPRWLTCQTPHGAVKALAFTLSRNSPSHTGVLTEAQYRQIFQDACGKYGTTLEYAANTADELRRHGIRDRHLERLLQLVGTVQG